MCIRDRTGGARGIGLTIAKRFHAERHTVIILDRDQASLEATKEDIKDMQGIECVYCDVSIPEQVTTVFDQIISTHHHIDALVNNAGIAIFKKAEDVRCV